MPQIRIGLISSGRREQSGTRLWGAWAPRWNITIYEIRLWNLYTRGNPLSAATGTTRISASLRRRHASTANASARSQKAIGQEPQPLDTGERREFLHGLQDAHT